MSTMREDGADCLTGEFPETPATINVSTGYATGEDGSRTPTSSVLQVSVRLQSASASDLRHAENQNWQNIMQVAYITGNYEGVSRPDSRGGDVLTIGIDKWLVVGVIERWAGKWCKVGLTRQLL